MTLEDLIELAKTKPPTSNEINGLLDYLRNKEEQFEDREGMLLNQLHKSMNKIYTL